LKAPARRTQQMRSSATQEKLLAATLDVLFESGYTRISTIEIAERAEVSRGALTHHYAAKEDLVAAAFNRLLTDTTQEIRGFAEDVERGAITLDGFVDHLWMLFSGRFFFISLEIIVESRHNPPLRERMIPVIRDFHAALDSIWREFFHETRLDTVEVNTTLNMTLCLLRGMGVQTVLRQDPPYYGRLLAGWKAQLAGIVEANDDMADKRPGGGNGQRVKGRTSAHARDAT
jgi:AcrR family transcriptional regulator